MRHVVTRVGSLTRPVQLSTEEISIKPHVKRSQKYINAWILPIKINTHIGNISFKTNYYIDIFISLFNLHDPYLPTSVSLLFLPLPVSLFCLSLPLQNIRFSHSVNISPCSWYVLNCTKKSLHVRVPSSSPHSAPLLVAYCMFIPPTWASSSRSRMMGLCEILCARVFVSETEVDRCKNISYLLTTVIHSKDLFSFYLTDTSSSRETCWWTQRWLILYEVIYNRVKRAINKHIHTYKYTYMLSRWLFYGL